MRKVKISPFKVIKTCQNTKPNLKNDIFVKFFNSWSQGCESTFFCGSGSRIFLNTDPDPAAF